MKEALQKDIQRRFGDVEPGVSRHFVAETRRFVHFVFQQPQGFIAVTLKHLARDVSDKYRILRSVAEVVPCHASTTYARKAGSDINHVLDDQRKMITNI